MNTITTLLYTQQEVDFLLYQIGRYGVDVNDVAILALQRHGTEGDKPLISGPGARYFGLRGVQELFVSGFCIVAYGTLPVPVFNLLKSAEKKGISDIFSSLGIPEVGAKKYLSAIRKGSMLVCIRVYNDLQEKHISNILKGLNDSGMDSLQLFAEAGEAPQGKTA